MDVIQGACGNLFHKRKSTHTGTATAQTYFCKVNVIASPTRIVSAVATEDVSNALGQSFSQSVLDCSGRDYHAKQSSHPKLGSNR